MNIIEIRHARKEDFGKLWECLFLMGKTDSKEKAEIRFEQKLLSDEHFIPVAIMNEVIVGYAWAQDYGYHLRTGKKTSRLHDLFVHPAWRHQSVAANLFGEVKKWARNNETSWLQWNSSPGATEFYQRLGLKPLETEADYPEFEIEFLENHPEVGGKTN